MKENFQIHIWLGLLLCLLGLSCSDDTPAKGDDPGNGNTELEVNEWIESVMRVIICGITTFLLKISWISLLIPKHSLDLCSV